jgi:acetolactate synthase-1/2/3 large subunit
MTTGATGAHLLLRCLEAHGIRHLFGVPGHGAYPIYDALHDVPAIEPIVGRDEQGVTFAAVGYAWASGDVAVATSVPAAGLANASTPLLEATWSQDRVLFVLEEDPVHAGIAASVARYHEIVRRHEDIEPVVRELFARLRSGRPARPCSRSPPTCWRPPAPRPHRASPRTRRSRRCHRGSRTPRRCSPALADR